jgi:hypothetical protein
MAELLDPRAHALGAFRVLPNGDGRNYSATTFPADPWQGCERTIRTARAIGAIGEPGDSYAVIDVLDVEGSIVQDFGVPTAKAFRWWKRKLNLTVVSEEAGDA